jgi:hypothetical protein
MATADASDMSVMTYQNTRHHTPHDRHSHRHVMKISNLMRLFAHKYTNHIIFVSRSKKVKLSLWWIKHHTKKMYGGSGGISPHINLSTKQRGVVTFVSWPLLYLPPPVSIRREGEWAPRPVWTLWRGVKYLAGAGNWTLIPRPSSGHQGWSHQQVLLYVKNIYIFL